MSQKAVIFDLDGVISDTQTVHAVSESQVLATLGLRLPADQISAKYSGVPVKVMLVELFPGHENHEELVDTFNRQKWQLMEAQLALGIGPVQGIHDCVERLSQNHLLAVGSGSPISFIDRVLNALGIRQSFLAIASSDEVEFGKPHPDVFLLAAERLGVLPEDAVVIEDGVAGMHAARSAGMKVVALDPVGAIDPALADAVVSGHAEITTELVDRLLGATATVESPSHPQ